MPDNAKAAPASARYVAIERSAKMPAKCEYPYVRIAVVLTTDAASAAIDTRRRTVWEVAYCSDPVPARGKTECSGYVQAWNAAREEAERLNRAREAERICRFSVR